MITTGGDLHSRTLLCQLLIARADLLSLAIASYYGMSR